MLALTDLEISDGTLPFRFDLVQRACGASVCHIDDWPSRAAQALTLGLDGPAMVTLASQYSDADPQTIHDHVAAAQVELGLHSPGDTDAARFLGLVVCRGLVRGAITTPDALTAVMPLSELDWDTYLIFAPAWEWDEFPEAHGEIANSVMADARRLLESAPGSLEQRLIELTSPS